MAAHEVWVSEAYAQDYSNASQRCFAGVAPARFTEFYQPCVAQGRFVRLRLVGELARSLSLATFEVLRRVTAAHCERCGAPYWAGAHLAGHGNAAPHGEERGRVHRRRYHMRSRALHGGRSLRLRRRGLR